MSNYCSFQVVKTVEIAYSLLSVFSFLKRIFVTLYFFNGDSLLVLTVKSDKRPLRAHIVICMQLTVMYLLEKTSG